MTRTVALLATLAAPTAARAAHPLVTDDTGTVGAAHVEVEVSGAAAPVPDARLHLGLGSVLHVGLTDRLDAGAGIGGVAVIGGDGDGLADPALDLKLRLSEGHGPVPGLAVRADYKPPLAGAQSSGLHDLGLVLIASWPGDRTTLSANAGGYLRDLGEGGSTPSFFAGASAARQLGSLALAAEVVAERAAGGTTGAAAMAALQWQLAPAQTLSLGVGPAWADGEAAWLATIGFTATFAPRSP